jgi:hypothetical protein
MRMAFFSSGEQPCEQRTKQEIADTSRLIRRTAGSSVESIGIGPRRLSQLSSFG